MIYRQLHLIKMLCACNMFAHFDLRICLFTLHSLNGGLFILKNTDHSLKTLPCTIGGLTKHKQNLIHLTRFLPGTYVVCRVQSKCKTLWSQNIRL